MVTDDQFQDSSSENGASDQQTEQEEHGLVRNLPMSYLAEHGWRLDETEKQRLKTIERSIIVQHGMARAANVVNFCVSNPIITLIGVALLVFMGIISIQNIKLDALPDLSDNQVVVVADWMGRSPEVIDDQVAYPLYTVLAGLPHVKDIRTGSSFGICMIYIIFDDAVDIYWARTRVQERLVRSGPLLPEGVIPVMGPEGTGVGHVYWYMLQNDDDPATPHHDLAELRSIQDWYVRYQLSTVPGVAEVASCGGFVMEYHVDLDPVQLRRYMIMPDQVLIAIQRSNNDVGGRVIEQSDTEFFVRSRGYLGSGAGEGRERSAAVMQDLRDVIVTHAPDGTPIRVSNVAKVQLGSAQRRGMIEHDGEGEAVAGIIVMRYGENAKSVIDAVKEKMVQVRRGLPPGVEINTAHDRSWLIERSIETLTHALLQEGVVVVLVIMLFLLSLRPSIVVILTLPIAVLFGFVGMYALGISSNIMSLGGIAIAIGVIVDDGIVMTENCHRHLAILWDRCRKENRKPSRLETTETVRRASQQISRAAFVTTVVVICAFLPVFFLTGQEGKLFSPLAWTKTLVMVGSASMVITLVPVLMSLIMTKRMLPEEANPLSRVLYWAYRPLIGLAMQFRWLTIALAVLTLLATWPVYKALGNEFMPNLNEGELVYMPTTQPNVTVTEAKRLVQLTDKIMRGHPLVVNVVGKAGRADTATDPAPLSMIESFVQFREVRTAPPLPRLREGLGALLGWRPYYSSLPEWAPEHEDVALYIKAEQQLYSGGGGSWHKIDNKYLNYTINDIRSDLDASIRIPGLTNGWTMPIINRIQMLATGVRTDLGIKIYGDDLNKLTDLAVEAGRLIENVPGVKDVFAERLSGGRYLDISIDREACSRFGLNIGEVQDMIEMLLGGMPVTTTVEGRNRFLVQLRYNADFRDSPAAIGDALIETPHQGPIPLKQVATLSFAPGPAMTAAENGLLRSLVFANVRERSMVETVHDIEKALDAGLELPPGYYFRIAGQWENIQRARARLLLLAPIVLLLIFTFLYLTFNNVTDALIVYLSLPFAVIGGIWYLWIMNFNISVAVWVGFIALAGIAVNTGVYMVVYLQEALDKRLLKGWLRPGDIYSATIEGSAKRLRPKLMTVGTSLIGLVPLMWATGIGADVMKPIAVPVIGGLISSTFMVLFVIPVLFFWVRSWQHRHLVRSEPPPMA